MYPFILLSEDMQLRYLNVLLKDTRTTVAVRIQNHIIITQSVEHKLHALNRSTMSPHVFVKHCLEFYLKKHSITISYLKKYIIPAKCELMNRNDVPKKVKLAATAP